MLLGEVKVQDRYKDTFCRTDTILCAWLEYYGAAVAEHIGAAVHFESGFAFPHIDQAAIVCFGRPSLPEEKQIIGKADPGDALD